MRKNLILLTLFQFAAFSINGFLVLDVLLNLAQSTSMYSNGR